MPPSGYGQPMYLPRGESGGRERGTETAAPYYSANDNTSYEGEQPQRQQGERSGGGGGGGSVQLPYHARPPYFEQRAPSPYYGGPQHHREGGPPPVARMTYSRPPYFHPYPGQQQPPPSYGYTDGPPESVHYGYPPPPPQGRGGYNQQYAPYWPPPMGGWQQQQPPPGPPRGLVFRGGAPTQEEPPSNWPRPPGGNIPSPTHLPMPRKEETAATAAERRRSSSDRGTGRQKGNISRDEGDSSSRGETKEATAALADASERSSRSSNGDPLSLLAKVSSASARADLADSSKSPKRDNDLQEPRDSSTSSQPPASHPPSSTALSPTLRMQHLHHQPIAPKPITPTSNKYYDDTRRLPPAPFHGLLPGVGRPVPPHDINGQPHSMASYPSHPRGSYGQGPPPPFYSTEWRQEGGGGGGQPPHLVERSSFDSVDSHDDAQQRRPQFRPYSAYYPPDAGVAAPYEYSSPPWQAPRDRPEQQQQQPPRWMHDPRYPPPSAPVGSTPLPTAFRDRAEGTPPSPSRSRRGSPRRPGPPYQHPHHQEHPLMYAPYSYIQNPRFEERTILKKKFSWKHYPEVRYCLH